MKRAIVIGIDGYPSAPLKGCVNDATAVAKALEKNGDGSPNFGVKLLVSTNKTVSGAAMQDALADLFKGDADTALFFFSGHGIINPQTNAGYVVSQDGRKGAWGASLAEIVDMANRAYPRIKTTVIVLDSCHSGFAGETSGLGSEGQISVIGNGVTILTACHRDATALEFGGHGIFSGLLLDGLNGAAADICGRITPASLYSHIDQTLGPFDQRPIYKANVQSFITLREVEPKIPLETLRRLPDYFPNPADVFKLDPTFERDRENIPEKFRDLPVNEKNVAVFSELQRCNRHGLVEPVDAEHMYYAAMDSTGCRLTPLGIHYRRLAEARRI